MMKKILIFRRGSIGDAVVSIPALNYIKDRYSDCHLGILSNTPVMEVASSANSVLEGSNFFNISFSIPPGGGGIKSMCSLRKKIINWGPDTLIYLSEPSNRIALIREYMFFRFCNIRSFVGLPFREKHRTYIQEKDNIWESEAHRLIRSISNSRDISMSWDFSFDQSEIDKALNLIQPIVQKEYIVLSIGSKLPDKDWGDHNWNIVIECITNQNPELGILCIGSKEEKTRSERLTTSWRGPVVNLCGRVNPRISALTMKKALFYLGHDSGPMHLAALVKTPCVAVFSARSKPGVWFPKGDANQILYPWSSLSKASSKTGFRNAGNSIDLITPSEVIKSCSQFLSN